MYVCNFGPKTLFFYFKQELQNSDVIEKQNNSLFLLLLELSENVVNSLTIATYVYVLAMSANA